MTEIVSPLTTEESTVLQLAAAGESMIDMGEHSKWHTAINSLVKRGFLHRHDQFNNVITPAGRAAIAAEEADSDRELGKLIEGFGRVQIGHDHIRKLVEEGAQKLAEAVRCSLKLKPGSAEGAVRGWGQLLVDRALDLVRGQPGQIEKK